MEMLLDRYSSGVEDTIGRLSINGNPVCYTLEDQYREDKVAGDTRIPDGRYQILLRKEGGKNQEYAQKFPKIHKGMLWLQNVPGFQFVLIHIGNTDKDTEGCILVGIAPVMKPDKLGKRAITGSTQAYLKIYPIVSGALSAGEEVWITVSSTPQVA